MSYVGKGKIPAIGVAVELEQEKFDKGIGNVTGKLTKLGGHPAFAAVGVAFAGITVAATAVAAAGAGAVAVMQQMVAAGFEHAEALSRQSKAIGINTQLLAEWQYAAKGVGVESEMLSDTWLAFQVQLGTAVKTGTGPVVENFDRLGIKLSEFAALKPEDQFYRLSDAVASLGDHAAKVSLLSELGMDPKTIALFEQGSDAIREQAEEARKLGLVLSDEQTASIQIVSQSVNDLYKSWSAIADQFTAAVAPAIYMVSEYLGGAVKEAGNWQETMGWAVDTAMYGLSWVVELGAKVVGYYQGLSLGMTTLVKAMVDGLWMLGSVADQVLGTNLAEGLNTFSETLGETQKSLFESMKKNLSFGSDSVGTQFLEAYEKAKKDLSEKAKDITSKDLGPGSEIALKVKEEVEAKVTVKEQSPLQAIERGSKEANDLLARYRSGKDYTADTAKSAKELVTEVKTTNRILGGRFDERNAVLELV